MIWVAYSLDARRAGRVPRRAAAVAAGARRARAAVPRAGRDARRRRCRRRSRARSATRRSWSRTGCRARRATPTPTAGRCSCPPVTADRAVAPIERDGREVAALVYDALLDEDPELVEAVRAAATIALEHEHLHAESEARLAEVQASRQRIVAAGDAERRRLERDLHDGAQQRLVALALQLRLIRRRHPPRSRASRSGW